MLMVNIEMISMMGLYEINNNKPKQPLLDLLFFLQVGLKENVISSNRLLVGGSIAQSSVALLGKKKKKIHKTNKKKKKKKKKLK